MIRKNRYLLLCLFLNITAASAQNRAGGADDNQFHIGYAIQYVAAEYKVFKQAGWQRPYFEDDAQVTTGLDGIRSKVSPGFGIGLSLSKKVIERVELRLTPTFVLNDRSLIYRYKVPGEQSNFTMNSYEQEKKVQAALVELPLHFKVKSDRRKNFGAYITGGGKYAINLKGSQQAEYKPYLSYEAGIGFDLFFNYFKLSPELKYSSTFNNVLKHENTAFSSPLDQLKLRQVTFSLYIQ